MTSQATLALNSELVLHNSDAGVTITVRSDFHRCWDYLFLLKLLYFEAKAAIFLPSYVYKFLTSTLNPY
jgi:hypothetical protein